ncbi:hypothetical protein JHW45_05970 [Paracoccus stylophorae]|uniref:Response regulatory domain-containing protein n=1 Tax=Paracoccus stylophorae TaxID=659350 RepID=A0ABY7SYM8_9RHOB|nr:hypothetical protein [Paracoccus stylophorae]WCR11905.1 hypothetical protein JHW45_05970 [Paracoccus stylophorae]
MTASKFRFVIIEKDSFVARDMQDGLQSVVPGCDIRRLCHPGQLSDHLADASAGDARAVIITKLSLAQLDQNGISQLARDRNAAIVVRLGEDSPQEVTARGWLSLASPFTWDDLAALAEELSESCVE